MIKRLIYPHEIVIVPHAVTYSVIISRFFMLKKDSERRHTLAQFMSDYSEQVS